MNRGAVMGLAPFLPFPESLSGWLVTREGHVFGLLDGPWAGCRERTVFWPDDEACDAECCLPAGHGGDRHYDQVLGWWYE